MGQLAGAVTKEDLATASKELAEQLVLILQRENLELKARVHSLETDLARVETQFHAEHARTAVLTERIDAANARAGELSRVDWLLTFLMAFGGFIAGFGISWQDLPYGARIIITVSGAVLILLPAVVKLARRGSPPPNPPASPTLRRQ